MDIHQCHSHLKLSSSEGQLFIPEHVVERLSDKSVEIASTRNSIVKRGLPHIILGKKLQENALVRFMASRNGAL
jgi:hypothetical protein